MLEPALITWAVCVPGLGTIQCWSEWSDDMIPHWNAFILGAAGGLTVGWIPAIVVFALTIPRA